MMTVPDDGPFFTGDIVFFKQESSDEWKGPARVIGQGRVVFHRHPGFLVRVHRCRLRLKQRHTDLQTAIQVNDTHNSEK